MASMTTPQALPSPFPSASLVAESATDHRPAYVYLLSDYDENGSDNVVATLNRDDLISMVDVQLGDADPLSRGYIDGWVEEIRATLAELLQHSDEELAIRQKHNLGRGWGGMQLHVVRLSGI